MATASQPHKHSQHTYSMPASVYGTVPCIHSTFQLFATIFVRNAG